MKSLNMVFGNIKNMVIRNTNFKKIYLLAGVIMAANMFVGNEMKATDTTLTTNTQEKREPEEENNTDKIFLYTDDIEQEDNDEKAPGAQPKSNILDKLLSHENAFNLFGGLVSSGFNNYLKWWDYNAGSYCNLRIGCLGWRTKKFFDIVQVDINLNVGRGISWVILGAYNFIKFFTVNDYEKEGYVSPLHFSFLVACRFEKPSHTIALILSFLFQGFVSAPLIFHISDFSISISIDSILWGGIGMYLGKDEKNKEEKEEKLDEKKE